VAEDSASVNCEPSYVLRAGLLAQGGGSGSGSLEGLTVYEALNLGYALVYPDYEGPQSQWLAGPQAGYASLDAIRAALSYRRDGLKPGARVGLWGYSGGGGATAWVAALKGEYAPELNVVGAAIGSASNSDLAKVLTNLDGGLLDGFIFTGIVGLERATPGVDLTPYLTPQGQALVASAADPNKCLVQELATFAGAGKVEQYTTTPSTPITQLPPAKKLLGPNSLVDQPTLVPVMPVLNYHDNFDEIVPVGNDNAMAQQWCQSGAHVEIERFTTPLPAVALIHVVGAIEGLVPALTYLADRFNGLPPRNDCAAAPLWSTGLLPYYPGIVQ
jgi:pimeloyl-ACP methyl ester carboxylesterase